MHSDDQMLPEFRSSEHHLIMLDEVVAVDDQIDLSPLLDALHALEFCQRYLHSATNSRFAQRIDQHVGSLAALASAADGLTSGVLQVRDPVGLIWHYLRTSIELVERAVCELRVGAVQEDRLMRGYRALRYVPYALENLYPLLPFSAQVDAFFSATIVAGVARPLSLACPVKGSGSARESEGLTATGVMHLDNATW